MAKTTYTGANVTPATDTFEECIDLAELRYKKNIEKTKESLK